MNKKIKFNWRIKKKLINAKNNIIEFQNRCFRRNFDFEFEKRKRLDKKNLIFEFDAENSNFLLRNAK